jgi:hypothetical protein
MTDIRDININDIKKFLKINNVKIYNNKNTHNNL